MSTDEAIQHVGRVASDELGAAKAQASSTGSILKRRKAARREARLGLAAQPVKK